MSIERKFFLLMALAGLILGLTVPLPSAGTLLGAGLTGYFLLLRNESKDYEFREIIDVHYLVIQAMDDEKRLTFYCKNGNWGTQVDDAMFFLNEEQAKNVISTFTEPDKYKIRKLTVSLDAININVKLED